MPEQTTVEPSFQEPTVAGWMRELGAKPSETPAAKPEAKKEEPDPVPPSGASAVDQTTTAATTSGKDKVESAKPATENSAKSPKPVAESEKAEDDEAQEKWPRSGDDWAKYKAKDKERTGKLKAEIAARDARVAEYEAKLKALETEYASVKEKAGSVDPATKEELERYKKEAEEYSQRLAVVDVTAHPKFVNYFKGKVEKEINLAKAIVGTDKAEEVSKVLLMSDGDYKTAKMEEIMGDLTPIQSQRLTNRIDALEQIEMERQQEIARAEENKTKAIAEKQGEAEKRATEGKKLFSEVVKSVQDPKNGSALFQLRDGDEAWNNQVKATVAEAERLLFGNGNVKPDALVKASLNAAAFPVLLKSYEQDMRERDDKISKLEAQVKELSAATPGAGKGAPTTETATLNSNLKIAQGQSPMEASAAWVKSIKAASRE